MEELRNWLLQRNNVKLYELLLDFIQAPNKCDQQEIVSSSPDEIKAEVDRTTKDLMFLFATDYALYRKRYIYGQAIVWGEVLKAYKTMVTQKRIIDDIDLLPDLTQYLKAVEELKRILSPYAKMQIALTELEEALGVDRFLDRVSEETFIVLRALLDSAKKEIERKTQQYKTVFQTTFDNSNVYSVIAHSVLRRNDDNQICDQFSSGNEQAILLLIDGFGFCQYLWNCGVDGTDENFTLKENLLSWLSKNNLSKECVLGSSFITDTGAGLAQVYLGWKSYQTRVYASKLKEGASSGSIVETKRINQTKFDSLFQKRNSITDVVATLKDTQSTVYYCSKYQEAPMGFSSCIFQSAEVKQVTPSERVFSILLEDIQQGMQSGLQVVYLTSIDNSGHTMGAYSGFEKQEHLRINYLLRSFLIELAVNKAELFDGHRSIFITADHGMFESSNTMISRREVLDYLKSQGISDVQLVENNRALLVYSSNEADDGLIAQCLRDYFMSRDVSVDVQTKQDEGFEKCLYHGESSIILPNIVARFVSGGLFFSKKDINNHLLHYGGHGGYSVDEVMVPLIEIPLNQRLFGCIKERFLEKL